MPSPNHEQIQQAFNQVAFAAGSPDARAEIRAQNVLLDVCLANGMSHDEPCQIEWAGTKLTEWFVSGVGQ